MLSTFVYVVVPYMCIFLKLCTDLWRSYKPYIIIIILSWRQQGGWAFENRSIEWHFPLFMTQILKFKDWTFTFTCVLIELFEPNKAFKNAFMCVCPRARTRGSARAPPWPAALPHPLQAAPAPPSPLPCLARLATETVPTVLSPVPPQPWRAGTAGLLVRSAHSYTKNSLNKHV